MSSPCRPLLAVLLAIFGCGGFAGAAEAPAARLIVGTDTQGRCANAPADWPAAAGPWNGKAARLNAATQRLVFEVFRRDIVGGERTGGITAPGVGGYYVAGPLTGSRGSAGTTVLYVSKADGREPYGVGCTDIRDGAEGMEIYRAAPATGSTPNSPVRQPGKIVHANQNKDLAAWLPDGQWLIAGVEMPRHALGHEAGNSELGMFNNLWAISADGKRWVQLTDFESTWTAFDPVAMIPYAARDRHHAPAAVSHETRSHVAPYETYLASSRGQPPPAIGTMRPVVGNRMIHGRVVVAWGERIGLSHKYTWGGALQLALAEIILVDGLPTLVNYRRNLTPTPLHPHGENLWSNPGGDTVIGAGYEPWCFSADDTELLVATDAFLSSRTESGGKGRAGLFAGVQKTRNSSQAFVDVALWKWSAPCSLRNVTAYGRAVYDYRPNDGPGISQNLGHWEEPATFITLSGRGYVAFGSSADLSPAWNPLKHKQTFGLDVWLIPKNRSAAARRLTEFNQGDARFLAYPTDADQANRELLITIVPGKQPGANPPGAIYRLPLNGDY